MKVYLPRPYGIALVGRTVLAALPTARHRAVEAVAGAGSLFDFAARQPGAVRLEGRGPAYAVPAAEGRWVVRHYRRGGAVARWLGDRYLAAGVPRPIVELLASDAVRRRGIETPEVAAVAVYRDGAFYRADIATAYVPDSADLADALFGGARRCAEDRVDACAAAGRLVGSLAGRGVVHRDLNLKNILLEWTTRPPRPYLLDLDRCRVVERVTAAERRAMLRRFWRSMRKWEARTRTPLGAAERDAFMAAYAGSRSDDA